MSDKWTRDQKISALSAATGVAGLVANSIKPLTDLLGPIYPIFQPVAFIAIGTFMGYAFTRSFYAKQLSSKDEEISELKNLRRERSDLFAEFRGLTHDEQRQIVSVMLSEPAGIAPSDEQREHMGSWVKMKDFVRHDAKTDRLHLLDGVKDMLLENPVHIYDLMAARVSDLERIVTDVGVSRKGAIADRDARIAEFEKSPTQKDVDDLKSASADELVVRDAEIAGLKSDKQPKYKIPSTDLIVQMSPVVASRVYKAYKRGAYIPLNEIEPCAINSIGGRDGLFEYRTLVNPFGQRLEAKEYGLSRKWRAFLDEPAHLAQLKTVAAGWLSPEE